MFRVLICVAAVLAPPLASLARAQSLLDQARWVHLAEEAPKLMLAIPGEPHPVFIFMFCAPGSGQVRVTVEPEEQFDVARRMTLTLRAGQATVSGAARVEIESPTGPYLEMAVPLRDPFWDALAAGQALVVQSPALPRPVTLSARGLPQPLRAFRAACAGP